MRQCAAYRLIGLRFLAVALSLVMPAACDSGEGSRHGAVPGASTDGAAASPDDAGRRGPAAGAKTMPATGGVTGDPDHDFVRMMSDHHKGLIVLAHMTKERADVGAAKADAVTLDREQDRELDMMQTMLEKTFKDPYSPSVAPEHRAMAEALQGKRGVEYARTFYRDIIAHHREAIAMIDGYLPTGRSSAIRQMAERMKRVRASEITEYETKVARLR